MKLQPHSLIPMQMLTLKANAIVQADSLTFPPKDMRVLSQGSLYEIYIGTMKLGHDIFREF